ncbi:vWA domain-containing protein [Occallatibacter riparius]|uniref:VWA domain-containing protein n=1 Tax=Occallatibacter riparius TaxID=1002689 RepID=A0A9J7BQ85_9BACT|nr:VWA domain-containing protein [Occallatibacter riparius]UWZ83906.1 VWA domain-containing protein [Occallatibacter riparius]
MKRVRYQKYSGDLASEVDLEDLLKALSDYFLDSGFSDPLSRFGDLEHDLESLREALRRILESGEFFDPELQAKIDQLSAEGKLDELIDKLIEQLEQQRYISYTQPNGNGHVDGPDDSMDENVRFEVTDKSLDFLGYKTLRDLLGSLGKSNYGRHDTRHWATGIEASGGSRKYEFGDVLNLDTTATLGAAIAREGLKLPLNLEYDDLHVHQCEYQSSCATVVMLDCSHSMILYGEDRFTPAKRVAMALSHLIRTQYPGDSLNLVLFHDSAEEMPVGQIARVKVGPWHTNTREGLRVAQRILARERKDMKQIVMITDGKPSALTLEDGRIYKNPYGLDPLVVNETLEEVARCKRSNVMINTFMLAQDFELVRFVQQVSQMCRGKAYFTSPDRLGEYLLMDFMSRKSKTIH